MVRFAAHLLPQMPVDQCVRIGKMCEDAGFDMLFIADEAPGFPFRDPFIVWAQIFAMTKKIKIGTGITNPYTRHPAMIANVLATLDEAAPGRVMLGISAGGSVPLVPTGNFPARKPIAAVREGIEVIRRLLAGETVDFKGEVIRCNKARVIGPPKQKIPIYMAARRPMMLRLLGEIADGGLIDVTPWALSKIEEGARKANRSLTDIDIGSSLEIKVVRDDVERRKAIEDRKYSLPFRIPDTPIEQLEGRVTAEEQTMIANALRTSGVPAALPLITDEIVDKFAVIGTPEEVISKSRKRMIEGVNFYYLSMPPGPDPQFAFKALGEQILPALGSVR